MPDEPIMTPEIPAAPPAAPAVPSTPPAAAAPPAPAAEPKPVAADPNLVNIVPLTVEQYNALLAERAENQRAKAEAEQKAREAQERAQERLLENGKWKEALEAQRKLQQEDFARFKEQAEADRRAERDRLNAEKERAAAERLAAEQRAKATEQRAKQYAKSRDLAQALSGHNLVPGGAQQLSALWAGELDVFEDGEAYATRSLDGKSAAEFVASRLAQPEYAHFVRSATHKGGTINGPSSPSFSPPPAMQPPAEAPQYANMGEWAVLEGRNRAPSNTNGGLAAQGLRPVLR